MSPLEAAAKYQAALRAHATARQNVLRAEIQLEEARSAEWKARDEKDNARRELDKEMLADAPVQS
jgi:hypothetical protein